MLRNQKGFALVIVMSILPVLIAGFFLAWASIGFIQQDLAMKYACRQQGIEGQKHVAPLLQKLLSLNPKAIGLKIQLHTTQAALAAAVAAQNYFKMAELGRKLQKIEAKRGELDAEQKRIIQESNRHLSTYHSRGQQDIRKNAKNTSTIFIQLNYFFRQD